MAKGNKAPPPLTETDIGWMRGAIDAALGGAAQSLITEYFDAAGKFAATTFDNVAEDDVNDPHVIGRDDLLAVTMLNVYVPAPAVRNILSPTGRDAITKVLRPVPTSIDLWKADPEHLRLAEAAWGELGRKENIGIGQVTAGKLLARKRPRLVPIVDTVVTATMPAPKNQYWDTLRRAITAMHVTELQRLHTGADLPSYITELRLLDVLVWMRGSGSKNAREVQARYGLPLGKKRRGGLA